MNSGRAEKGKSWAGAWQIVRFNWPAYLLAFAAIVLCISSLQKPLAPRWLLASIAVVTMYFSVVSLIVSHWVYDLSPWSGDAWLSDLVPPRGRALMVQTGFDSSEGRIQRHLSTCAVVDLYGTPGVGGASVRRAHRGAVDHASVMAALPAGPAGIETVVAAFALHEIRSGAARRSYFKALEAALVSQGCLVVVEHLRDWKNFAAFGLGFLHFLPAAEWTSCAAEAGFKLEKQISMTPFVHVFLWRKP